MDKLTDLAVSAAITVIEKLEAENSALKDRAEKAEAKLSELHAFLEEDIYSVAPVLREEGLEHFGGYFTNWDTVIDHCAIILDKDIYYAEDPIELFYRIKDRLDEREAELARVQERAEKAEEKRLVFKINTGDIQKENERLEKLNADLNQMYLESQEQLRKAESDLKSALDHINQQSFTILGLEMELKEKTYDD